MQITYFGTGAGEGWPGIFCRCPICEKARLLGGKNIRTRSQALIDDGLLLDLPPDTYMHTLYGGLDLSKVHTLLITHSHADHFFPYDLEALQSPFSHTYTGEMNIYGNDTVEAGIRQALGGLGSPQQHLRFRRAAAFQPFMSGAYEVIPLPAVHTKTENCLFYCIKKENRSVLYAHDTGAFTQETVDYLARRGGVLSLVSLDCTMQKRRDGKNHMGLADAAEQKDRLLRAGLADENTIWVVNHFSHNGGWLHEELADQAEAVGFIASYDGMSIRF